MPNRPLGVTLICVGLWLLNTQDAKRYFAA